MDLDINQAMCFPLLCERTAQPYGEETGLFYLGWIPLSLSLCCWGAPSPEFQTFIIRFSNKYRALVRFLKGKVIGGWKSPFSSCLGNEAFYFSLAMLSLLNFMSGNRKLMIACC